MDISVLDDPFRAAAWINEVGEEEAFRQIRDHGLKLMKEDGPRAILPFMEKIDDLQARIEEFDV